MPVERIVRKTRSAHPPAAATAARTTAGPKAAAAQHRGTAQPLFLLSPPMSALETHDLVTVGLPVVKARELMASYKVIERSDVLRAVGISERTLQRGNAPGKLLDANASDRALRLAAITELAIQVLGSQDAAERWLASPAIGLDQRRPIDLMQSTEGTELVKTLLTRMDYGVYA